MVHFPAMFDDTGGSPSHVSPWQEVANKLIQHVVLADLRTGKLPKVQADLLLKRLGRCGR